MTNVPQPFPPRKNLTRADARKFAEELWRGRLTKATRVGRLGGLFLLGISLLVRFFVEVPRDEPLLFNNLVFLTGAALLLFASVAIPVTTQCLLLSDRRAGVARTRAAQ
jgi:prolipoprotein diacylglyceryltransferase